MDTQEQVAVHTRSFGGDKRGNYFEWEPVRRIEVGLRVRKLKNENAEGMDKVTEEIVKGGGQLMFDWLICM